MSSEIYSSRLGTVTAKDRKSNWQPDVLSWYTMIYTYTMDEDWMEYVFHLYFF